MDDKPPQKGCGQGHMTPFSFDAHNHISGTAEASVAKFCTHVEYIKCWPWDDRLTRSGCGQGHVALF